jgi:hypothetical protein
MRTFCGNNSMNDEYELWRANYIFYEILFEVFYINS